MNWRDHLTPAEIDELAAIDRAKKAGQAQARRIYDRCRKRLKEAENKSERENLSQKGKTRDATT